VKATLYNVPELLDLVGKMTDLKIRLRQMADDVEGFSRVASVPAVKALLWQSSGEFASQAMRFERVILDCNMTLRELRDIDTATFTGGSP
jgi:hypothetical protein